MEAAAKHRLSRPRSTCAGWCTGTSPLPSVSFYTLLTMLKLMKSRAHIGGNGSSH